MDFAILGTIRLNGPAGRIRLSRKQRAVIAALLLHPNATVSTDRLISAVWDEPPRSAVANIQTYVSQLRRLLEGSGLEVRTEGSGYVCEVPPGRLDLQVFEEGLRRARAARTGAVRTGAAWTGGERTGGERTGDLAGGDLAGGDLVVAEREYAAAIALWRGTPAEDVPLSGAIAPRITELEERLAVARSEWIDVRLALGREDLVAELRALVAAHPLRERLWEQLVVALGRGGRRDEALDAFRQARELLVAELGIEPGPELRRLHAALLAGDTVGRAAVRDDSMARAALGDDSDVTRQPSAEEVEEWEAVPVAFRRLCQLPADTADFVGREAEIAELTAALRAREDRLSPPIVIVSGLPGIGKTTLAVHLAHLLRSDYPDGQLFVRLGQDERGPREPGELLDVLLRSLGLDGAAIPASAEGRARLLRQRLADRAVLVVLDDAVEEAQLRHLLPGTPRGAVLVTSRSRLPALEGAIRLTLDLPDEKDARILLERVAGQDRIGMAPGAAEQILRSCGRLPLAIRVAGARLATRPVWPVSELATRLAGRGLDELVVGGLDVRATFEPSYAALPDSARRAFRLLGLTGLDSVAEWSVAALLGPSRRETEAPHGLTPDAAAHGLRADAWPYGTQASAAAYGLEVDAGPYGTQAGAAAYGLEVDAGLEADAALETLVARGMLTSTEVDGAGQPRYRLHDLLRVYARERAEAEDPPRRRREALTRHVLECLRRTRTATRHLPIPLSPPFPRDPESGPAPDVRASAAWLAAERRTLMLALAAAAELGLVAPAAELAHHLTGYLLTEHYLDDAEQVQRIVIGMGDECATLRARLLLATVDVERGRYVRGDEACEALLADLGRAGDTHGAAYALISRAGARHGMGRLDEALADAYAALDLLAAHGDTAGLAYAWTWPIWIHLERGEHGRAAEIVRARLAVTPDEDHTIRGHLLRGLGTALYQQGETAEAVACYRESLLTARAVGGRGELSKVLRRLGEALGALGRFDEAAETLTASLRLFVECGDVLGEALAGHALGVVRLRQGDPGQALGHLGAALERLGGDGPEVWRARTLLELGRAYALLGRSEESAVAWRDSLALFGDAAEAEQVARFLAESGHAAPPLERAGGVTQPLAEAR
ncbi:tetratricopeptide repeat protein [Nonomuraea sp. PA05]|uniref:AfsR/SARP family transcriptional regulator n=1 Tax=Nonomuraea sp. PA05 TaxID=2604466 RepID=UPI0011DC10C1|nr:BTAD domain-containing putative transcriptional regulator [Nonomuraea sp. PA05]TYB47337.1 tetratricopeptide repeat protein [Nonomuraea sp. PA05]